MRPALLQSSRAPSFRPDCPRNRRTRPDLTDKGWEQSRCEGAGTTLAALKAACCVARPHTVVLPLHPCRVGAASPGEGFIASCARILGDRAGLSTGQCENAECWVVWGATALGKGAENGGQRVKRAFLRGALPIWPCTWARSTDCSAPNGVRDRRCRVYGALAQNRARGFLGHCGRTGVPGRSVPVNAEPVGTLLGAGSS